MAIPVWLWYRNVTPDSKVYGANMGPTWVLSAPGGPHVGPMNMMNLVIRDKLALQPSPDTHLFTFTIHNILFLSSLPYNRPIHSEEKIYLSDKNRYFDKRNT